MKKIVLILSLPFLMSCSYIPEISKEDAINRINVIKEKYQNLENVESKFIILKEGKKDNQLFSTSQLAFDEKQEMLYFYEKDELGERQEWQYFETIEDKIYLWDFKNVNNNKTKNKSLQDITGINYFKKIFANIINEYIDEMTREMAKSKKKELYRAWWGKDLNITIEHERYNYKVDIVNNRFHNVIVENLDEMQKVDVVATTTFDYDNFYVQKPDPNDYHEI